MYKLTLLTYLLDFVLSSMIPVRTQSGYRPDPCSGLMS